MKPLTSGKHGCVHVRFFQPWSADKYSKKAVLWQGNRTYDSEVKFDTYQNLQRHRAVSPAIAWISFFFLS